MTDIIDEILDTPRQAHSPSPITTAFHSPRHRLPNSLMQEIHNQWERASQAPIAAERWSSDESDDHSGTTETGSRSADSYSTSNSDSTSSAIESSGSSRASSDTSASDIDTSVSSDNESVHHQIDLGAGMYQFSGRHDLVT